MIGRAQVAMTVRLPKTLHSALVKTAKRNDRSVAAELRVAIDSYLAQQAKP